MSALLVAAVVHIDGAGRPCSISPLDENELLNAVDSLQRHLAPMGIRVSLSTSRRREDGDGRPQRDLVHFNGVELAEILDQPGPDAPIDSAMLLRAGLAAVEEGARN